MIFEISLLDINEKINARFSVYCYTRNGPYSHF